MNITVVDRLHTEFTDLLQFLDSANEVSLRNTADDCLRKSLLMASASFFERRMTENVVNFVAKVTSEDHVLTHLVRSKVISRQYHTWFDWDKKNANGFFAMFGPLFQTRMKEIVAADEDLKASIQAFLEVGNERNRLVHQDFGSFSLEKTSEEIYNMYTMALKFVDWFPTAIEEFLTKASAGTQTKIEISIGED